MTWVEAHEPILSFVAETVLIPAHFPLDWSAFESYVNFLWSCWVAVILQRLLPGGAFVCLRLRVPSFGSSLLVELCEGMFLVSKSHGFCFRINLFGFRIARPRALFLEPIKGSAMVDATISITHAPPLVLSCQQKSVN